MQRPSAQATPAIATADAHSELTSAFALFNNLSAQLEDTYREMEQRVGSLNQELHTLAEQRLQELQEKERVSQRLESLLNLLPAGVVVLDSQGRIQQCNPAAEELLESGLTGRLWRDVIKTHVAPRADDGHEVSLISGRRISLATRSFGSEGGQLLLLTDLTETRELQRRLSRHQRLSEMGRMMSALAHQIRTPLSAAMLYAGHLSDSALSQEQIQRFAGKVLSRLGHLEQQVKDMLIFAKGDLTLTDTLSSAQLFAALEAAMEMPLAQAGAHYEIKNAVPALSLQCNRDSMVGALMNLINNAVQARQDGLVLTIRGERQSGCFRITIADNGPGIAADLAPQLQEPFFTTKPQGTGLGLAVVRSIISAHHGRFALDNHSGGGVIACIDLPIINRQPDISGE